MSTEENKSLLIRLGQNENKDAIPNRIQFIKTLLNNNSLKPIIDFDNTDTENFISKSRDDEDSAESYDTRATLRKEVHDITTVINNMGGTLQYIKSGTTGHTFKGEEKDKNGEILYEYGVKVVAYSIKDRYGGMHDTRRPENAELLMIKLLSYFIVKRRTPHIVLPIGTFDTSITNFTNLIEEGYVNKDNEKYKEFVQRYHNGEYYDEVSILISEWANRGDLNDFIKKNFRKFTPIHWKVIFFQLISTLAVIQSKFPAFRHNDLKANNILVRKINKNVNNYKYKVVGDMYGVPNIGYQIGIWDFDFACIPGIVDNKKVMISNKWSRGINVGPTQNRYYDVHYFFNTLIKKGFFPELMTDHRVPQEVKDFVLSIVPLEYQKGDSVSKGGRILHNMEYTTPVDILRNNPYFEEFRIEPKERVYSRVSKTRTGSKSGPKIDNFLKGGVSITRQNRNKTEYDTENQLPSVKISSISNVDLSLSRAMKPIKKTEKDVRPKTFTKDKSKSKSRSKSKSKSKNKKQGTKKKTKSKSKSKSRSRDSDKPKKSTVKKVTKNTKAKPVAKRDDSDQESSKSPSPDVKKKPTKAKADVPAPKPEVKKRSKRIVDDIDIENILMGRK